MFKKIDPAVSFPKMEENILRFWDEHKIFEQSVSQDAPRGNFIFYEGPPTANGKPGLHHVLARAFKDIIPRYKTMKGYRVERKAGWDTHGLPVELQVEKALGLKSKQDIENIVPGDARASIIRFNEACKESVWEYRDLWEKMTKRMGYWVDMEHPYVTYENEYIESVWWQLARIAELKNTKGESFLYKGHKVVPYCYRCGTALSSHEVAQGYRDVKDLAVTVKFEFVDEPGTFVLAWTTTPWTLPGNVALAINRNAVYYKIKNTDKNSKLEESPVYILAKDCFNVFTDGAYEIIEELVGSDLIGRFYKPLYETAGKEKEKSYRVIDGSSFVTTDSGTGIVHIAPAFGEDDANVGKENDLPTLFTVEADGTVSKGCGLPGEGIPIKKKNDKNRFLVDDLIIEDLKKRNLFFKEEMYEHEYPFCWRCDTPLIYFAKPSWFIRMSEVREALEKNNEAITWVPEHIKEGRFGEWLRGAKDWAISRERYWGTPLPIWECIGSESGIKNQEAGKEGCGKIRVISSVAELEALGGKKLDDVHKPYIDDVTFECQCGGTMKRTPEVLDVWFDSGAMPLAQFHYPQYASEVTQEKVKQEKYFPADYICEAIDQTRGWFYTLHAVATLLHRGKHVPTGNAYKNVICLGFVNDAEGKKMSKSKGNIIDPFEMFEQFGADQLRWYFFSINQPGMNKRFDIKGMRDVQNRVFRMLWNSYSFFTTYASIDAWEAKKDVSISKNILDAWILSELQLLIKEVDASLTAYDVYTATKKIESFIDNLSNWYIRRSRKRFWKSEDDSDKECAYQTLYTVLVTLAKVMAPFTPFLAEEIYHNLVGEESARNASQGDAGGSVHLADWPEADGSLIDTKMSEDMRQVRDIVALGLKLRADAKIKVRQPLGISSIKYDVSDAMQDILREELNIKGVIVDTTLDAVVVLNTDITPELKLEGAAREIIRAIQEGRKKAGFNVEDRITLGYQGGEKVFDEFGDMVAKEVLATSVQNDDLVGAEYTETVTLDGAPFTFFLKKV